MSRKLLSLGVLAAAFTLVLGTTDAQARCCRSQSRTYGCCQNSNYVYGNCGNQQAVINGNQQAVINDNQQAVINGNQQAANNGFQQTANYGSQQVRYVTTKTCCNPRPTCCVVQPACATSAIPASLSAPQPREEQIPVEQAPAPASGN